MRKVYYYSSYWKIWNEIIAYMKIEMKFLSLEIVKRNGRKYDDFCKEIFKICREAYRVLHFEMNIPNNRFNKDGCIERRKRL